MFSYQETLISNLNKLFSSKLGVMGLQLICERLRIDFLDESRPQCFVNFDCMSNDLI